MIRKYGYRTYEEAVEAANALLWEHRKGNGLTTEEHSRTDRDGGRLPLAYIEDKDTGATVYLSSLPYGGLEYDLTFLSGEEAKESNRAYPFREVPKDSVPFLMAVRAPIFKPVREVKPEEALTPDGLREIRSYFGYGEDIGLVDGFLTKEQTEEGAYTIDTAFEVWEDEDGETELGSLLCRPLPQDLQELTGVRVKTPSDYARGIGKLLGAQLSKEQRKAAIDTFLFYASEAFLMYAIYEFTRTEDYGHLKAVLSCYGKFYLPDKWEEGFSIYRCYGGITTEIYVLARYFSKWHTNLIAVQPQLKEVAEYTGTPLPLMLRAYRTTRINDF